MSANTTKKADTSDSSVQLELIYSDNNQFRYWSSNLFNDVYLRKDLPTKYADVWSDDDSIEFQNFLGVLRDLAAEYGAQEKHLSKWSETETINNWIKLILSGLGWNNKCTGIQNPYLEETSFNIEGKTYRTDILIVDLPKEKQYIRKTTGNDKLLEARESVLMPVEAKYWKRLEQYRQNVKQDSKRTSNSADDISRTTTPNDQTLQYMKILQKDWGILTDGAIWRLFNRELGIEDSNRYYEFNLAALIESITTEETEQDRKEVIENAKYFYFFFSKKSFYPEDSTEESFVNEILRYSKRYVNRVEEDLKARFVKAMNFACNGLQKAARMQKVDLKIDALREICESMLFNVLFTKSLESRNVLPMNAVDYRKLSLSSLIDKIEKFDPEKDDDINSRNLDRAFRKGNGNSFVYDPNGHEIHERMVKLTEIIHDGRSKKDNFGFEISGFRESVFDTEEWRVFRELKLGNQDWVNILFQLGYAESGIASRKYQQIPYSFFTPRQLGSIYESFLEFRLDIADKDMVFEKKQWKKADLTSKKYRSTELPIAKKGHLFFTPDNKDRKATGSYYTPDYIVQHLVKETIGPLVERRSSEEILKVSICDPAMGSGHFLVSGLNFLTNAYLTALADEVDGDLKISLSEAKRKVLDSCIYGVDINPRAVKLAKMSLWLESAHINCKLEKLSDQLKSFNSIINEKSWSREFPTVVRETKGFSAIIGNPPWGASLSDYDKQYLMEKYDHVHQRTPDSFNYFLGLSYEICSSMIGQIIPNNFLFQHEYSKARRYLVDNFTIDQVINLGDGVFSATVPSALLVISKKKPNKSSLYKALDLREADQTQKIKMLSSSNMEEIGQSICLELPDYTIPFDVTSAQLVKKLSDDFPVTLGDISDEVAAGIGTGGDKIFRIEDSVSKSNKIEKSLLKPVLVGRYLNAFNVPDSTGHSIIYSTKKTTLQNSPNALKYLKPFEEKLSQKREAKKGLIPWWSLHWPRNPSLFERTKIVVRQTSSNLVCAVDENNYYCLNSIIIIHPKDGVDPYLVAGILNSSFMNWFYQQITQEQGRTFAEVKPINLRKLPFPDEVFVAKNKKIIDEIISISKKLHKNSGKTIQMEKLDSLVCELYGLSKKEQKAISNSQENAA